MSDNLGTFGDTAKALSRNPLGIIALFIVLVYGMAALVLGLGNGLGGFERALLVIFLVTFPPGVLWVFRDLVIKHTGRLYSPGDYKDEVHFVDLTKAEAEVVLNVSAAAAIAPRSGTGLLEAGPTDATGLFAAARQVTAAARAAPAVPKILWVDDNPNGNLHERRALEAAGFSVHTARSTEEAERRLAGERFDVVISDMGRTEGTQAGYDLLETLRQAKNAIPFIIYAGSASPALRAEAKRRGALDSTNDPKELLELVTQAIRR